MLDKIELLNLSNDKLLIIIGIKSGLVKTVILEMDHFVPRNLLEKMNQLLNERLQGVSIDLLLKSFDERFRDVDSKSKHLLQLIKQRTQSSLDTNIGDVFHFSGAVNVLAQPEFETRDKVGTILELIDRKDILIHMLNEHESDGVSIVIGEENEEALMKDCSLITTSYRYKDASGTLGVIGPTRMQYDKIIALVQFMAETLGYLMNKPDKTIDGRDERE
jgi:heat-inducible transcriptional repressor